MTLSILIPTYNRALFLERNLTLLIQEILSDSIDATILVSDNCSSDNTHEVCSPFLNSFPSLFSYYCHNTNLGYEKNLLFILSKATSDYVLLLGDDDYLASGYLKQVSELITNYPQLGCILPNFKEVDIDGRDLGAIREKNVGSIIYNAGFDACLKNAWRAHQLSGIVFRRENVLNTYTEFELHNLYPQVFFVSYVSLYRDVIFAPEFPVSVTRVPQLNKDWSYDKSGLLCDIFDNFRCLGLSNYQRGLLELSIITHQPGRYLGDGSKEAFLSAFHQILKDSRMSFIGKLFFVKHIILHNQYKGLFMVIIFFPIRLFVKLKEKIMLNTVS